MNRQKRILFVNIVTRPFIEQDIDILSKQFEVRVVDFILSRKQLKGTLVSVLNTVTGVLWADITFSWFAGFHAALAVFLSKLLRKKSIVVTGGYDVANEPGIDYGEMRFPKSKSARIAKFALRHADRTLAVSEFNKKEASNYVPANKLQLIYNAVDCDKFKPAGNKNDNLIITVSGMTSQALNVKGLKTFVKTAEYLPNMNFILIGQSYDTSIDILKAIAPSNVEFKGYIPHQELPGWYQKARVYCQLSYRESFGLSLAEAMACSCIPVVTGNTALTELVGDTGFYVPYDDPKATAEAIKLALKSDKGEEARERIVTNFPLQKRAAELINVINDL